MDCRMVVDVQGVSPLVSYSLLTMQLCSRRFVLESVAKSTSTRQAIYGWLGKLQALRSCGSSRKSTLLLFYSYEKSRRLISMNDSLSWKSILPRAEQIDLPRYWLHSFIAFEIFETNGLTATTTRARRHLRLFCRTTKRFDAMEATPTYRQFSSLNTAATCSVVAGKGWLQCWRLIVPLSCRFSANLYIQNYYVPNETRIWGRHQSSVNIPICSKNFSQNRAEIIVPALQERNVPFQRQTGLLVTRTQVN